MEGGWLPWEQVSFRSSSSVNWGEPDLSEPHTSGTALQDACVCLGVAIY